MAEINRVPIVDGEVVYEFNIHDLGEKSIFEFIQKIYSDNTKWKKPGVLVDALVYRCPLESVLEKFKCGRPALEWVLSHDFDDCELIISSLDEIVGARRIGVGMPEEPEVENNDSFNLFKRKKEELPLWAFVDNENYSDCFEDFDIFNEKAVEKAFDVLCTGKFIPVNSDFTNLRKELKQIFSNVENNGLVFGEE